MERSSESDVSMDRSYTIIFGSHCNTCLKIEKNSQESYKVCGPLALRALAKLKYKLDNMQQGALANG